MAHIAVLLSSSVPIIGLGIIHLLLSQTLSVKIRRSSVIRVLRCIVVIVGSDLGEAVGAEMHAWQGFAQAHPDVTPASSHLSKQTLLSSVTSLSLLSGRAAKGVLYAMKHHFLCALSGIMQTLVKVVRTAA